MEMSRYLIKIPYDMTKNDGLQISGSGGQTMREFQAQNMKNGYFWPENQCTAWYVLSFKKIFSTDI